MFGSPTIGVGYPGSYGVVTHAVIAPYVLPDAYVDRLYDVTLTIVGTPWVEPTTWQMFGALLPPCVTWDARTHTFHGIPMRVSVTTGITVRATDATGRVFTRVYTLTVRPTP